MSNSKSQLWQRFQQYYTEFPELGLALDISRMNFSEDFLASMEPRLQKAFAAMAELEKAKVAHDHADVSVRVYAGRRNARESWKQAPDPQGGFLFLEYRDRGATIERQSPSFVN